MAPRLQNRARMKRPLLAAAVALPVAVVAAIATAPTGKVVDLDNYNATATTSYINAAQCADTAPLNLEWSNVDANGGLTGTGKYKIYASDTPPPTTTSGTKIANFCPETDDTAASPQVHAGQLGSQVNWTSDIQRGEFSGVAAAALASADCTRDGDVLYICAHLYDDATSSKKGYASGKFIVQVAAPDAPTGVTAGTGDTRLYVSWTASGGTVDADHYIAAATPSGGGTTVYSSSVTGEDATIDGLVNGTTYSVVVVAYSVGGNPSLGSTPAAEGTPRPVDDFWERYVATPGAREEGGCGAGGTGPLALLSLGLLALLRRRS